jgi:NADH-quinone oxidoreductase subunit E
MQAMEEAAEFLGLAPAEVLDTATFYEEYWLKPKGQYLIQVCRSLSCEICGSNELTSFCKEKLGLELGESTADGRFTLVELECLGACGTAPVALVNEVLHEELTVAKLQKIIDELPKDPHDYKDPFINWQEEGHGH